MACRLSVVSGSAILWTIAHTEVGGRLLLQGIFLMQGLNLHLMYLLNCRQIPYL